MLYPLLARGHNSTLPYFAVLTITPANKRLRPAHATPHLLCFLHYNTFSHITSHSTLTLTEHSVSFNSSIPPFSAYPDPTARYGSAVATKAALSYLLTHLIHSKPSTLIPTLPAISIRHYERSG